MNRSVDNSAKYVRRSLVRPVVVLVGAFSLIGLLLSRFLNSDKDSGSSVSPRSSGRAGKLSSELGSSVTSRRVTESRNKGGLKGVSPKRKASLNNRSSVDSAKNLRQQRILSLLERKGEVAMSEVKSLFSGVNVRTVRRDLDLLVKKGLIKKEGTTRSTVYKSKS